MLVLVALFAPAAMAADTSFSPFVDFRSDAATPRARPVRPVDGRPAVLGGRLTIQVARAELDRMETLGSVVVREFPLADGTFVDAIGGSMTGLVLGQSYVVSWYSANFGYTGGGGFAGSNAVEMRVNNGQQTIGSLRAAGPSWIQESAFFVASVAWRRSLRNAPFILSICLVNSVSGFFSWDAAGGTAGDSSAANAAEPMRSDDRITSRRGINFME